MTRGTIFDWISAHGHDFAIKPTKIDGALVFKDRGLMPVALLIGLIAIPLTAGMFIASDVGFRKLLTRGDWPDLAVLVFGFLLPLYGVYRLVRALLRRCTLVIDPQSGYAAFRQTWPRRINVSCPIPECVIGMQPVVVIAVHGSWSGFRLYCEIQRERFTIAMKRSAMETVQFIPEDLAALVRKRDEDVRAIVRLPPL